MTYDALKEVIKEFLLGNCTKTDVAMAFALWQRNTNGVVVALPANILEARG